MINSICNTLQQLCAQNALEGNVSITINNITCVVESKSGVGTLIEEWFGKWLETESIRFARPNNSQSFPDYKIYDDRGSLYPTEVKCFDYTKSPNFDVAQFETFARKIPDNPQDLDCDYIIFGYTLDNNGIKINEVWHKKIWEITTSSASNPIKLQVKQGTIHNIRPCTWYSSRSAHQPFESKQAFLSAMNDLIQSTNQVSDDIKAKWLGWRSF